MSESKHTRDKWYVGGNGRDILVFDEALDHGQLIATVASYVYSEGRTSQGPETARLIASAPDLLEALKQVTTDLESALRAVGIPEGILATHKARAAIAKAEGRDE